MLAWLIKNAAAPLTLLVAGMLGVQTASLGMTPQTLGALLGDACTVAGGGTLTNPPTDPNLLDQINGAAGIVTAICTFLNVTPAVALPILQGAAERLASRPTA